MLSILSSDAAHVLAALSKSLAIIEFDVRGKILHANENFCRALGYQLHEIAGQHHRLFAEPAYAQSEAYASFWAKLGKGEFVSGEFKRVAKGGREVWIQASYNPVANGRGKIYKVVKFASDITAVKRGAIEDAGKLAALSRSQALIEFTPTGEILTANENFLSALGYGPEEIRGQHHRMFVDPRYGSSAEYAAFWDRLRNGEHQAADFKRIGKGGREVWIQASYNPIFDDGGRVYKVVKFATNLTDRMSAVSDLGLALGQLADGDLEQRITRTFVSSMEPLRANFNNSVERLQDAMRSVSGDAGVIRSGADQLRMAADDLAKRTEQQAAALEETSAALSEITSTVQLSSRRAEEAGQLVARTKNDAERSGRVVNRAIEAMRAIEQSSDQIGKIIGVIDEIAFQTNLLALNAGVEAARAGEAGRGFAVVAQEVRGLAQRSAEAAKEIKELISTSGIQVTQGVEFVGQAGHALEEIVGRVGEINTHVASIVEAARGQAIGLAEINTAVSTLDASTQQNAAMVEESTAASNELAAKAVSLNDLLGMFRLDDRQGAGRRGASPVGDLRAKLVEAFPQARRA